MSTFVRRKTVRRGKNSYVYLQLVRNERVGGKHLQRVLQTLGREDLLDRSEVDRVVAALAPFTEKTLVLKGPEEIDFQSARSFGDFFLGDQLWRQLGLDELIDQLPRDNRRKLDLELLAM